MLPSKPTTLEGGNSKLNADDINRQIGMALIQEPYQYQGKITGITKGYRTYAYGEGKRRAAIIIQDNTIDALLITQLSNNDAVLMEINNQNLSF